MIRESAIEKYLVRAVKARGGRAYKWVSPGNSGVPDRIIFRPDGHISFVELKAPSGKLSTQQKIQIRRLNMLGHGVFVFDSKEQVDNFISTTFL